MHNIYKDLLHMTCIFHDNPQKSHSGSSLCWQDHELLRTEHYIQSDIAENRSFLLQHSLWTLTAVA